MKFSIATLLFAITAHAPLMVQAADIAPASQSNYSARQEALIDSFIKQTDALGNGISSANIDDLASINQATDGNFAAITQFGNYNHADIAQSGGSGNVAMITQVGNNMTALIAQRGSNNIAMINQR